MCTRAHSNARACVCSRAQTCTDMHRRAQACTQAHTNTRAHELVQEAWPGRNDAASYRKALRTNEDTGKVDRLLSFTAAMANVKVDYELVSARIYNDKHGLICNAQASMCTHMHRRAQGWA